MVQEDLLQLHKFHHSNLRANLIQGFAKLLLMSRSLKDIEGASSTFLITHSCYVIGGGMVGIEVDECKKGPEKWWVTEVFLWELKSIK